MAADQAPRSRTRRYVYGGLLAAAAVAIGLALIFTVGGAGKKEAKAAVEPAVSSLDDKTVPSISDVLKDLTTDKEPEAPAEPVPVTPVTPTKPAGGEEKPFTQADADGILSGLAGNKFALGDPMQAAAWNPDIQEKLKQAVGTATCWPQDADELTDAVENQDCPLVVLTNGDPDAYALEEDIQVTRSVRVMGNPAVLPTVDGSGTTRCFTVGPGGFLELSFVRTKQGGGETRDRYGLEGLDLPSQVVEIRGGAVAVEPGALGANFVGVLFTAVANTPESVQNAITSTLNFVGGRIYGGHVFVAAGNVNFFGCNFWDTTLFLPLTDQVSIGGDVLVIGGNVFFTGCIFTASMIFGNFGGLGFNVGVLGGNMVMTFCVIQAQGVAESANGAGQVLFVGGGTMILTGVDFRFASACLLFTGIGDFFVGGGVMVFTGVTIENAYPILAAYGAGFYLAVGGGVMVETGVTYVQYNAPAHQALTGASIFVGAGTSVHTGVPASFYGTTILYTGQGGWAYNGAGYSMWLGCPIAIFAATFAFFGLGGLTSQPAGFMVYIGNPAFTPCAISYFVGAGVVMFLGAGGAVVGGSPVYAPAFIFRGTATPGQAGANYYVNGNQEYANGIGYMNKDGKYGYFYDKPAKEKARALTNQTRALAVSNQEAFDGAIRELKAQRKLSVSNVNSLLNDFAPEDMFGPTRFIGAGLEYKPSIGDLGNKAVWDSFSADADGWVPPAILSAARDIQNMKNSFGNIVASGTRGLLADSIVTVTPETELQFIDQDELATLAMDAPDVEYCGVCGEGTKIVGSAADQCMEFETCDAFRAVAPEGTEAAFDWKELSFDPWYIVQGEMNPASDKALNVDLFRDGLRSFFVANESAGVHVTAYSMAPDALFADIMPKLPESRHLSVAEGFGVSNPMKVVFLVNDKAQAEAIKDALTNQESEEHDNMLLYLQDYLAVDDFSIKALDSKWEKDTFIPAYGSALFAKAFAAEATKAAGTNSVRLVEQDKEGLPLTHAAQGAEYVIQLANFKPDTALTVQLIGSQEVAGVAKQTVAPLGSVTTDKDGMATLKWAAVDAPAGTYYLKAVDSTGAIFGMTPAIDIVAQARRKLYGPLVEL